MFCGIHFEEESPQPTAAGKLQGAALGAVWEIRRLQACLCHVPVVRQARCPMNGAVHTTVNKGGSCRFIQAIILSYNMGALIPSAS